MPTCPGCHRFKKKSVWHNHKKYCHPSKKDIAHFLASKGKVAETKKIQEKARK